nr:MAP3K7 C-terminal-like protein isoform X1 [Odocoileus virginianus texanus]
MHATSADLITRNVKFDLLVQVVFQVSALFPTEEEEMRHTLMWRKELIAKLDQAEKEKLDAAQLAREFEALTEENRTLKLAQSQCVEQLEKLRIQYQKRQGSS